MEETAYDFIVPEELADRRVDVVSAELCSELTRSAAQKLLEDGLITVNEKPVTKKQRVSAGDRLQITIPAPSSLEAKAQDIPLSIVYEDDDLLVVDKPKGMVVHPAPGNPDGTLVNALLYHCGDSLSGINGVIRPGIVHRIDKDTSGLLIVAKNDFAHVNLAEQIRVHSFTREYRAVVHGNLKQDEGTVNAPIGRSPKDRKKNGRHGPPLPQCGHPLSSFRTVWGLHLYQVPSRDRTNPSNPGPYGVSRPPAGR